MVTFVRALCGSLSRWRAADGHNSSFNGGNGVLCDRGRVHPHAFLYGACHIVDAVTGQRLSRAPYLYLAVDTSGALVWLGPRDAFMASSGPGSDGSVLRSVKFPEGTRCFRFGVFVAHNGGHCSVVRFDGEPVSCVASTASGWRAALLLK